MLIIPHAKSTAQLIDSRKLIADTLRISVPVAESDQSSGRNFQVVDNRQNSPRVLGVRQVNRYLIIPVDQYLILNDSLANVFRKLLAPAIRDSGWTLYIDKLDIWHDDRPFLARGWMLNAETRLTGADGNLISLWQWEFKRKQVRKQKFDQLISVLMQEWLINQQSAMIMHQYYQPPKIHPYRRVLHLWENTVFFKDGYAIDGRLSLYYPADQQQSFLRGVPGIYYRHSPNRESIAIGGKDLHWYYRASENWLLSLSGAGRIGFNRFNPNVYDYLDWWNLFLVNIGMTVKFEWNPQYHRGITAGVGLYQDVNLLPEVVDRFDPGLLLSIGLCLP